MGFARPSSGAKPATSTCTRAPRASAAPRARDGAQVAGIGLVVGEDEAAKAVAGETPHDLDDQPRRRRRRERHGAGPGGGQRAGAVGQRGREQRDASRDAASAGRRVGPAPRSRSSPRTGAGGGRAARSRPAAAARRCAATASQTPSLGPRELGQADHARQHSSATLPATNRGGLVMRIGIIGAGAIGCVVGGMLTKAGRDVTLIDQWPEHVETMRRQGLRLSRHLRRSRHPREGDPRARAAVGHPAVRRRVRRREVLRHGVGDGAGAALPGEAGRGRGRLPERHQRRAGGGGGRARPHAGLRHHHRRRAVRGRPRDAHRHAGGRLQDRRARRQGHRAGAARSPR